MALDKPLIGIPTTEALAYNLYGTDEDTLICPIMDARRSQVYTGVYCFQNGQLQTLKAQDALPMDALLDELNQMGKKVIFLGDGVPVFCEKIQEMCQVPYLFAPGHVSRQRAGAVAALGEIYYRQGKIESAREHQPDYLRVSQAERERAQRLKKSQNV